MLRPEIAQDRARARFAAASREPAPGVLEAAVELELLVGDGGPDAARAERVLESIYDGRATARIASTHRIHVLLHVLGRATSGTFSPAPRQHSGGVCNVANGGRSGGFTRPSRCAIAQGAAR